MTVDELKSMCEASHTVTLSLPWEPNRRGVIRLLEHRGPSGEVVCCGHGKSVVRFDSKKLLRFIKKESKAGRE